MIIINIRFENIFKLTNKTRIIDSKPGEKISCVSSHATRHGFVLLCMAMGKSEEEIARMGRWINVNTLKPYYQKQQRLLDHWLQMSENQTDVIEGFIGLIGRDWDLQIQILQGLNRKMKPNDELGLGIVQGIYFENGVAKVKSRNITTAEYMKEVKKAKLKQ